MNIAVELTKYLMLLMMGAYTYHAFRSALKRIKYIRTDLTGG